ncbi:hypothetical protein [Paractinoplanes hotanensis]|uniref:Uncharacterized protein n=1 Tax=Paractinoplanes hotanensis TaxID=2906497 RepID=A0ABT0Y093_9ACTN|nr:hypothetical protein [Actinoplanes hotanensis]MCM4078887.1 hypothetical protein [Actinoplanes hotanensis]
MHTTDQPPVAGRPSKYLDDHDVHAVTALPRLATMDGMFPDKAAAFIREVIRANLDVQTDVTGPRSFQGVVEWEFWIGWDDGNTLTRYLVMPALSRQSAVFVAVASQSLPHMPGGRRPEVPPFEPVPKGDAGLPVDGQRLGWAGPLRAELGGYETRQWGHGWIGFFVDLADESPWVGR